MSKTCAELITRVKQLIGRTGTDSANLDLTGIIIDAFNDAQIRIVKDCPHIPELQVKDKTTLTLTTDEYEYDISDFDPPIAHLKTRLWIIGVDVQYKAVFVPLNKFDEAYPDVESIAAGLPNRFTVRGATLEFNCPVSSDYNALPVRLDYTKWATPFDEAEDDAECDIVNADRGLIWFGWSEALRVIAKSDASLLQAANEKLELFENWLTHFADYHDMQAEEPASDYAPAEEEE
jgi:hypothetical protein